MKRKFHETWHNVENLWNNPFNSCAECVKRRVRLSVSPCENCKIENEIMCSTEATTSNQFIKVRQDRRTNPSSCSFICLSKNHFSVFSQYFYKFSDVKYKFVDFHTEILFLYFLDIFCIVSVFFGLFVLHTQKLYLKFSATETVKHWTSLCVFHAWQSVCWVLKLLVFGKLEKIWGEYIIKWNCFATEQNFPAIAWRYTKEMCGN